VTDIRRNQEFSHKQEEYSQQDKKETASKKKIHTFFLRLSFSVFIFVPYRKEYPLPLEPESFWK